MFSLKPELEIALTLRLSKELFFLNFWCYFQITGNVILKNHLRLLFIYKSQLLIFYYMLLCNQLIINFLCLKMIKICNIILSYLEENQKPCLAQWQVDIFRKRRIFFQLSIRSHVSFETGPVTSNENLKS